MSGQRGVATKLFIGNLPDLCRPEELQSKFEKFGNVVEFDIVGNYGFAHYGDPNEARAAADALNGTSYNGNNLRVEISHSKVRQKPGMGHREGCYRCGKEGHWSKDCPKGPRRPRQREREPYNDDPYLIDSYPDPYRSHYPPPQSPPHPHYSHYYDPYDRRPPPPPRDVYLRERLADSYGPVDGCYYPRRSPPSASSAASDAHGKDPYIKDAFSKDPMGTDPYGNDPYMRDMYASRPGEVRDSFEDTMERRRAYAAAMRSTPYAKPAMSSITNYAGAASYGTTSSSFSTTGMQSSRVPGPY